MQQVVIIGGGPGGYEAALVGRRLGAQVVLVEKAGLGGAAVLTDVVPSKSLIATAEWMTIVARAPDLGINLPDELREAHRLVDMCAVNARLQGLAVAQSHDIERRVRKAGVEVIAGTGRLVGSADGTPTRSRQVAVRPNDGGEERLIDADVVLIATGATPRVLPTAVPDGERILSWTQLYGLTEMPGRLIVVGSGVTGAEFAGAYSALGVDVVLVSSRDQVLPNQDPDAAALIERVFTERGMTVLGNSRAEAARRTADGVVVELDGGRTVEGTHALIAVGSVPTTHGLGLAEAGVRLTASGHIEVDRVSRTSVAGVYAAGDCTGVLPLASVSAQQGRIAMSHALGDAVRPLSLAAVATNVFTAPEIAAVGQSEEQLKARGRSYSVSSLPLARNPRAKMLGIHDGFVKIFTHTTSGTVLGAVIVAPRAGELIYPLSLAVTHGLTVDHLADASTVYPSLTGTIAEVARRLHHADTDD
jgi:dihydrolipoamide dehydrogenase